MRDLLAFFHRVGKLKTTLRAGWVLRGVPQAESVAEHTFRMAVMALVLAKEAEVDVARCVKMALVHDLAEAITGDITPDDPITQEQKYELEYQAIEDLVEQARDPEIRELWEEYSQRCTREAKFVHDLDKIEMLIQAYEYQQAHGETVDLEEFWENAEKKLLTQQMKEWFKLLRGLETSRDIPANGELG